MYIMSYDPPISHWTKNNTATNIHDLCLETISAHTLRLLYMNNHPHLHPHLHSYSHPQFKKIYCV